MESKGGVNSENRVVAPGGDGAVDIEVKAVRRSVHGLNRTLSVENGKSLSTTLNEPRVNKKSLCDRICCLWIIHKIIDFFKGVFCSRKVIDSGAGKNGETVTSALGNSVQTAAPAAGKDGETVTSSVGKDGEMAAPVVGENVETGISAAGKDGETVTFVVGEVVETVTSSVGRDGEMAAPVVGKNVETGISAAGKDGETVTFVVGEVVETVTSSVGKDGEMAAPVVGENVETGISAAGKDGETVTFVVGEVVETVTFSVGKDGEMATSVVGENAETATSASGRNGETVALSAGCGDENRDGLLVADLLLNEVIDLSKCIPAKDSPPDEWEKVETSIVDLMHRLQQLKDECDSKVMNGAVNLDKKVKIDMAGRYIGLLLLHVTDVRSQDGCVCHNRSYYADKIRRHYDAARSALKGNDQKLAKLACLYENCIRTIDSCNEHYNNEAVIDLESMDNVMTEVQKFPEHVFVLIKQVGRLSLYQNELDRFDLLAAQTRCV